jgi:hypothetical protein
MIYFLKEFILSFQVHDICMPVFLSTLHLTSSEYMPFQYIDVIDVANFVRTVLENKLFGAFNVTNKSILRDEFFNIGWNPEKIYLIVTSLNRGCTHCTKV